MKVTLEKNGLKVEVEGESADDLGTVAGAIAKLLAESSQQTAPSWPYTPPLPGSPLPGLPWWQDPNSLKVADPDPGRTVGDYKITWTYQTDSTALPNCS